MAPLEMVELFVLAEVELSICSLARIGWSYPGPIWDNARLHKAPIILYRGSEASASFDVPSERRVIAQLIQRVADDFQLPDVWPANVEHADQLCWRVAGDGKTQKRSFSGNDALPESRHSFT